MIGIFGRNDFNDGKCRTSSGNIENYGDVNQVSLNIKHLLPFYLV